MGENGSGGSNGVPGGRKGIGGRPAKHEIQEFNGVRYYLKPNGYFKSDLKHGGEYMHRAVWAATHGHIPDGMHIHHIDGIRSNNQIQNLEMLSASEHSIHHAPGNGWVGSDANREQLRRAGSLAKEWHASEAGKEWHATHAVNAWADRKWHAVNCKECGRAFGTPYPTRAKFCHQNCKAQALRRRRGKPVGVRPEGRKAPVLHGKRAVGE